MMMVFMTVVVMMMLMIMFMTVVLMMNMMTMVIAIAILLHNDELCVDRRDISRCTCGVEGIQVDDYQIDLPHVVL